MSGEQPLDGIFTDDMDEYAIMDAFNSKIEQPTETEEVEKPAIEEEVVEEATEIAEETTEPVEEVESNVIDFSQPFIVKDRGINLPVNNKAEATALMEKGLNYTRKTQELSQHRSLIDYASEHNIDLESLQTFVEAKTGNKEAVAKILKDANIDPYDIDTQSGYKPNPEFAPKVQTEADSVAAEILADKALAESFKETMEYVPDSFKQKLGSDADVLRKFSQDVKTGVAKELLPEALKLHALNGGDFINSYIASANKKYGGTQQVEVPKVVDKAPVSPNRAKASITTPSGSKNTATSVWDMDDASFMERIREMSN